MATAGRQAPAAENSAAHIHHWMIETQDGPASNAVCRSCGARRDFENAFRRSASWRVRAPSVPATQPANEA